MALRLLLSNRSIIPQRISLTRFCRYYTPLSFDQRSINSLSSSNSHSSLYCSQLQRKSPSLLSPYQTYFLSYKLASSFSSSSSSSDGKPPSSPSSSDENSSSSSFSSSNDGRSSGRDDDGTNENPDSKVPVLLQPGNPLMAMEVPDKFPIVPLIPVSRHPLFPKFIKMLEVTNKDLVELIRRKVKLNQPYAGIFLRKEPEKTTTTDAKPAETSKDKEKAATAVSSDMIKSLDEVYKIGAFVQIHEVHDMGDRLRMIVMAHRRIRIVGLASDEVEIEDVDRRRPTQKTNGTRRRQRRKGN